MKLYRLVKRTYDVLVSVLILAVLSPALFVVAVLVRFKLGSPVIFRQERVGLNRSIFVVRKFRTMTNARDEKGELLPDVERLTAFGAFLRSTSLDELPELWNVVVGDMSLVGPRPLHVRYLERYSPAQHRRHEVRPGVTGLAQVNGRNAVTWDQRFLLDVEYVDNVSAHMDLKILLQTVRTVLSRDGVSEDGHVTMTEFQGSQ
jgi:lipopolysaccharide/colanic/teichoic acid biosynthesis glycosyltransferase